MKLKTTTSKGDETKIPSADSLDAFSKVVTDYGTAFSDFSCFEKEILAPVALPPGKSVLDVFATCFDDGAAVLEEYHRDRKDTEQKWEPWRPTKDGGVFRGQRQFTCTTLVKAMMGKPYAYVEYERYAFFTIGGCPTLAVQFSSQIAGVMFGDAFRAEALTVFTQSGSGSDAAVSMRALGHVQFLKNVWVKSKILSTSLNVELPEGYKTLANMIVSALRTGSAEPTGVTAASPPALAPVEPSVPASTVSPQRPQSTLERHMLVGGTVGLAILVLLTALRGVGLLCPSTLTTAAKRTRELYCGVEDATVEQKIGCWGQGREVALITALSPCIVFVYLFLIAAAVRVIAKTAPLW